MTFLASPDALEVIVVTDSLTEWVIVSRLDWCDPGEWWIITDDTYWRLDWCYSAIEDTEEDEEDEEDQEDQEDEEDEEDEGIKVIKLEKLE